VGCENVVGHIAHFSRAEKYREAYTDSMPMRCIENRRTDTNPLQPRPSRSNNSSLKGFMKTFIGKFARKYWSRYAPSADDSEDYTYGGPDNRSLYVRFILPYIKSEAALKFLDEELHEERAVEKLNNLDLPESIRKAVNFMVETLAMQAEGPRRHLVAPRLLQGVSGFVKGKKVSGLLHFSGDTHDFARGDLETGIEQRKNQCILAVLTLNHVTYSGLECCSFLTRSLSHSRMSALLGRHEGSPECSLSAVFALMNPTWQNQILDAIREAYGKLSSQACRPSLLEKKDACPGHASPIIGAFDHAWTEAMRLNAQEQWYMEYHQTREWQDQEKLYDDYLINCGQHLRDKILEALVRISEKCTSTCWCSGKSAPYLELCKDHGH